jgi:cytochrome c6
LPRALFAAAGLVVGAFLGRAFTRTPKEDTTLPSNASGALAAAAGLAAAVVTASPALAADLENGESAFLGNCAACHAGGGNSVVAEKTLKLGAIDKYLTGGLNVDAIKTQVTNGKGSMPAFGDKLGPDDIEDVAAYVFDQATNSKW